MLSSGELETDSGGVCSTSRVLQNIVNKNQVAQSSPYCQLPVRRKSFHRVPLSVVISEGFNPSELSEAGIYYDYIERLETGTYRCFKCNLVVQKWRFKEDPFEEHFRLSPQCSFIKNIKQQRDLQKNRSESELNQQKNRSESDVDVDGSSDSETDEVDGVTRTASLESDGETSPTRCVPNSGSESVGCESQCHNDMKLCKKCGKSERSVMFGPCSHLVACKDCSNQSKICFECQQPIQAKINISFLEISCK